MIRNLLDELIKNAKLQQQYESALDNIGFDVQIDSNIPLSLAEAALSHENKVTEIKGKISREFLFKWTKG